MAHVISMPPKTRCPNCGTTAAEVVCHICKTDKAPSTKPCRYFHKEKCDCGGRGYCLTAA